MRSTPETLLEVALDQARRGLAEGGAPFGAILVAEDGAILGRGRNRVVQDGDFLLHAETSAIRDAGALTDYRETTLVTTMVPCWYCAGLVRYLGIGSVIAGDCRTWSDEPFTWLASAGVETTALDSQACVDLIDAWTAANPDVWESLPVSVDGLRHRH